MFDLFKDKMTAVAVDEDPEVGELTAKHSDALRELSSAERECRRLVAIVDGIMPSDEETFLESKLTLPGTRQRMERAMVQLSKLTSQLTLAREQARRRLDDARSGMRKPLIADVFAKFLEAVEATEGLIEFDLETVAMGGSTLPLPCPALVREVYEFQKGLARKDGLLS
jgi:hypothetical protein